MRHLDTAVLNGRFEILGQLGSGGMGTVYLSDDRLLERQVALKVLPRGSSDEMVQRFCTEAKAMARIKHPNVIDIYDLGQTQEGEAYLAMEALKGSDLAKALRAEGPMPWPRAQALFLQVCSALQAAHDVDVIHRDLKPENVFLVHQDSGDWIKVLDFGIAKLRSPKSGESPGITEQGFVLGTPAFIAPEQVLGKPVDARADVYSAACLLYTMLTNRRPYSAKTFEELIPQQLCGAVPALAEVTHSRLPIGLQEVMNKALARDPDQRFASMAALGEAIAAIPASGRRGPELVLAPARTSKRPWPIFLATACMFIAGGVSLAQRTSEKSSVASPVAALPVVKAPPVESPAPPAPAVRRKPSKSARSADDLKSFPQ